MLLSTDGPRTVRLGALFRGIFIGEIVLLG